MSENYVEMAAIKWLKLIANEKLRKKVLKHTSNFPGNPNFLCSNIREALFHAFSWEQTEEGEYYWLDIYNSDIELKEPDLSLKNTKTKRNDLLIAAGISFTAGIVSFWIF